MPAPTDWSGVSGEVRVFIKKDGSGNISAAGTYQYDPLWRCDWIQTASRSNPSLCQLSYNIDVYLRGGASFTYIPQDAYFAVLLKPNPASNAATVLFEGCPKFLERKASGVIGAALDTASIVLEDISQLYRKDPALQVVGSYVPKYTTFTPMPVGTIILDPSLPCVFNPGGKPNRSFATALDSTGSGGSIYSGMAGGAPDVHYFTYPGGMDFWKDETGAANRRKSRFWTYGQAIAYVLWWWLKSQSTTNTIFSGTGLWFGTPPPGTPSATVGQQRYADQGTWKDAQTPWGAVIGPNRTTPIYKMENPYELYEAPGNPPLPPATFVPDAQRLLTAKCNNVEIEGMNALDALQTLCFSAGLGIWYDNLAPVPSIATFTQTLETVCRCWTPGGAYVTASPGGIGSPFIPLLQPVYATTVGKTAAQVIVNNNVEIIDANTDWQSAIDFPVVTMAPTQYEVTVELRPGWQPIHNPIVAYIDNVSAVQVVPDASITGSANKEINYALGDASAAFRTWVNDPTVLFGSNTTAGSVQRIKFLCQAIHTRGVIFSEFGDVLRKWILPTDASYPTSVYGRNQSQLPEDFGLPKYFRDYAPCDFSVSKARPGATPVDDIPLLYELPILPHPLTGLPLPGPASWPHRRRKFLPCLVADSNGQSVGYKVELNFHGKDPFKNLYWFEWPAFEVLPDELGVRLSFENPFDVTDAANRPNSGVVANTAINLFYAYVTHNLRVRITATIEGSNDVKITPTPWAVTELPRANVTQRSERYFRRVVCSKHADRVTADPHQVTLLNAPSGSTGGGIPPVVLQGDSGPTGPDADRRYFLFKSNSQISPSAGTGYEPTKFPAWDDSRAALEQCTRLQSMGADPKFSSTFTIPWIELGARPGMAVKELKETQALTGEYPRNISFATVLVNGQFLCPAIAGVTYTFSAGGFRSTVALEDWRAMAAKIL